MSILQAIRSRLTQNIGCTNGEDPETVDDGNSEYESPSLDM